VEGLEALARSARVSLAVVSSSRGGAQGGAGAGGLDLLTPREREVVAHVVAGRTYGEIARALFLSEKTVSSHISNILRKTGTSSRGDLAQWAHRQGGSVDGSSGGAGTATDR
jgi:DNA-binding CsgD family transcriptional regulator